ncbi:hypothetical protein EYC98_06365 [Halieaceae bacterium IMCC14734]|uniref:Uncharacterized protein n=1 Tax=Candidatus Litorirhabdus singularis TaxID=2518993 RepID=A0ABT3TDW6_9GAMM|nr:hypothetical protein [Candidatus Litorirhabdus singularis]MCX2980497.1 hypothetical protein [Candidatus Litorirhabdus singularis]
MSSNQNQQPSVFAQVMPLTPLQRFGRFIQDPMGSVIAASIATMSTLGFVLSGMWFINFALN